MQASEREVAKRYGKALFQAASRAGHQEGWADELAACLRLVKNRESLFVHPLVSAQDKKKRLTQLLGERAAPEVVRFLHCLVEKKRFRLLPLILDSYRGLLQEHKGVVKARLKTAFPMDSQDQERVRAGLENFSGKKVLLDVSHVPELIGGMVVELGDWVLDGSYRKGLEQIRKNLAAEK